MPTSPSGTSCAQPRSGAVEGPTPPASTRTSVRDSFRTARSGAGQKTWHFGKRFVPGGKKKPFWSNHWLTHRYADLALPFEVGVRAMTEIERQALQIVRQMLIGGLAQSEHPDVRARTAEQINKIEQRLFDPDGDRS